MRLKILALLFFAFTFNLKAEKIKLTENTEPPKFKEVPVDVDISGDILNVKLIKDTQTSVIVSGPEGIVAHKYLSTQNGGNVDIYLQQNVDGEYNITVINNSNGDVFEGDFTVSKNNQTME